MKKIYIEYAGKVADFLGAGGDSHVYVEMLVLLVFFIGLSVLMWWIARNIGVSILVLLSKKTKTQLDDHMIKRKVFSALAHIVPLLMMDYFFEVIFYQFSDVKIFLQKANDVVNVFVILMASLRFMNAVKDTLYENEKLKDKPITSYIQLAKILISGFLIILMLSIATNQSPVFFLTSLGALTAVLLLVFKDTILGFVGSIQLSANDMIRIGDWVTMEKYGADGDVFEINLTTVKVRNFDRTITTIPTYAFISDSFINWRGMSESGGRRIKRAVNIEVDTIRFCTPEMLKKYKSYQIISDYLDSKEAEINEYNKTNQVDKSTPINGRNQTNAGLFRVYITEYLKRHPEINKEMTIMVRQLASTDKGLPMEIYCFSSNKDWGEYERIMSDIFDHVFAAANYFDLELFESPSGSDLKAVLEKSGKF